MLLLDCLRGALGAVVQHIAVAAQISRFLLHRVAGHLGQLQGKQSDLLLLLAVGGQLAMPAIAHHIAGEIPISDPLQ
jgi:hypothetical protein